MITIQLITLRFDHKLQELNQEPQKFEDEAHMLGVLQSTAFIYNSDLKWIWNEDKSLFKFEGYGGLLEATYSVSYDEV